jgi:hypothetical protein
MITKGSLTGKHVRKWRTDSIVRHLRLTAAARLRAGE